jgi:peptidoglycan/LPS O-acetylase OafA/YrhL
VLTSEDFGVLCANGKKVNLEATRVKTVVGIIVCVWALIAGEYCAMAIDEIITNTNHLSAGYFVGSLLFGLCVSSLAAKGLPSVPWAGACAFVLPLFIAIARCAMANHWRPVAGLSISVVGAFVAVLLAKRPKRL